MAASPAARKKVKDHPSGDNRYKTIDRTMKRFKYEKDALLEVLNAAQETFGHLSEGLLLYIATHLEVPMSQVYGVATFYHLFTFKPLGEHNCVICTGTACHVKGADKLVEHLAAAFDVEPGGTTADGKFSLTTARCVGSCGLAPVVVLNGDVRGKGVPADIEQRIHAVLGQHKAEEV